MNVYLERIRKDARQTPKESESFLNERIGLWADVTSVHSENNCVDIITDTGYSCINIPVISSQWVCSDKDKSFVPSERNLPPVGSRVFILMPNYNLDGAFVLCSGYAKGEKTTQTLWARTKDDIEKKNNIREEISQSGWNNKEYFTNGNITKESVEKDISLIVGLVADDDNSIEKGIKLTVFENEIVINEDGISITDKNGSVFTSSSDGLSVMDCNENKFSLTSEGINIEDCNGNKVDMTSSGVSINGNLEVAQ